MASKLRFVKMWEGANTYVFDIDPGSVLPILNTVSKISSFADKDWLYFFDKGIGAAYYEEDGILNATVSGKKDFLNPFFQKKYFDGIRDMLVTAQDFVDSIYSLELSKISTDDLLRYIERGTTINTDIFGYYLSCQPQYISGIETEIKNLLSEYIKDMSVIEISNLLSTSTKITTIREEEIDWINLLIKYKDSSIEDFTPSIERHLKKYQTLHSADGGLIWNKEYLLKRFNTDKDKSIDSLNSKLVEHSRSLEEIVSEQNRIIKKYNIPKEIIDKCSLLAEIGHQRLEMRIKGWMPVQIYLEFLAKETAKRFSYDPKIIKFARVSEVVDILKGNKSIDVKTLEKRSKNFLITILDKKVEIYGGQDAVDKFRSLVIEDDLSHLQEIKGNIAMKGKVTGVAVVFKWTDNMEEKISLMTDNSILIAGQTRPQLMPLLVKSRAIVTDEGGITSHAAIVSRELKIPCIIGTKIGTQAIKDGDLVEVDGNKGIVTILKKVQ